MDIRQLAKSEAPPMDLLLEADPSEKMVRLYLDEGQCYVAEVNSRVVGVYVLMPLSEAAAEIKNIAVAETERGKGYGKRMIKHALDEARKAGFRHVEIGTGNSSFEQLALYQKCGFRMKSIDRGFFTRNYPEPIVENGLMCQDMVRLEFTFQNPSI
ncbi:putative N-acetyltransferase YvbK [Planococcus massiliensis]|uniref:Putative N-acetyltransferase YvbK n=1 Tax=Planococcus massiliensis TaxID=1499687 RepID=A0A098ES25_9BACL|nr:MULTISPECIES: GNAT family N-acetyltransferase [Planococcus]MCJ1909543.1 GNAT family N-acetyltransferase [Planococcus ruber]CEG24106.1 putative N-acetyltransferase YvbK [Planococcus massiliensis]